MSVITVSQKTPASIQAMQIGGSFDDFTTVLPALAAAAYQSSITCLPPGTSGGAAVWQVALQKPNYPAQVGAPGDWIVFDGVNAQIVTNDQMAAQYQAAS
jgi:hypothetical protein